MCVRKGVSISKMEDDAGIGNGTVRMWEKGKRNPSLTSLEKLASYFGMKTLDFIEELLKDES